MITWHLSNANEEWELEMDKITVLKGNNSLWYKVSRLINQFYNEKNPDVQLFEDTQLIQKKDWDCIFIPYDAHLQLEKIKVKSPLKPIIDDISHQLSNTPAFFELMEIWSELEEELDSPNQHFDSYGISVQLLPFNSDNLKQFLYFNSSKKSMTPLDYKHTLLKLCANEKIRKKRLIIIEMPELFADEEQIKGFFDLVQQTSLKGINFIVVTDFECEMNGAYNYLVNNTIINSAKLEKTKRKVINRLPFVCDDHLYNKYKKQFLSLVDNFQRNHEKIRFPDNIKDEHKILFVSILNELNIGVTIDTTAFPTNIQRYLVELNRRI